MKLRIMGNDFWYSKRLTSFCPVATNKPDIPMPTGSVEKLFEPPASSFSPDGH
ncbi:MAG: hypothetical protein KUG78_16450 [Kangiellaceae bacterium]|nr:hypothetical protein [Kangiellaceae bacterium]